MIIAVVSKKGGVGKTTTSVSLSAALARTGQRVLLVDLDPNAGASLSLGLDRRNFGAGAAGLFAGETHAFDTILETETEGLEVIPASVDLRSVEGDLTHLRQKELVLGRALEPVRRRYDTIFLDCPSSLGLLSRNALVASDGFLVPAVPHFLALEGLEQIVATAERLRQRYGHPYNFLGVVLTMVDYRTLLTRRNVVAIRERFGEKVFAVEVRTNVRLAEAPAFGQTIFDYSPKATGAMAYQLLAEEIRLQRQGRSNPGPATNAVVGGSRPAFVPY